MSPARKDDESIQTSLRELMKQEEDRLEQLRAAKLRIDRERAEAAREAEEERQKRAREELAELEAKKVAAIERARIEAVPAPPKIVEVIVPASPKPSRFGAGFAAGFTLAALVAAIGWFVLAAPRLAHAAKLADVANDALDVERSQGRDARAKLDDRDRQIEALRAENDLLRRRAPGPPKITPKTNAPPPRRTPSKPTCDPRDPLCGDL